MSDASQVLERVDASATDGTRVWLVRAALAMLVVLYGLTYKQWIGACSMGGLLLLTMLPISIELDRIGQVIVGFVCLVIAYTLAVGIGPAPPHPISQSFSLLQAFSCVWALSYCGLRLFFKSPFMGHSGTFLFAMVALFACGGVRGGLNYHLFVLVFAALALWTLYLGDPSRPLLRKASRRRRGLLAAALLVTGLVTSSFLVSLPIVYQWASTKMKLMIFSRHLTGFDMFFKLGSLRGLIKSKRVVLRVKGPYRRSVHLRGAIYNRYRSRCWVLPRYAAPRLMSVPKLKPTTKMPYQVAYVSGESSRYFVPLGVSRLGTPKGAMRVDDMGLALPLHTDMPDVIGFAPARPGQASLLKVAKPGHWDVLVPRSMRTRLRKLALSWVKGIPATNVAGRLQALRQRLNRGYRYSLSFTRPRKQEPIINFLFDNKQGHCEYFASSLALLARSIGISTRVAGGYLMSEYNQLGQYYIVRGQNAHAWVEAWVPGKGWQTYDATPASGIASHMPKQASKFGGFFDFLWVKAEQFRKWLISLSYLQLFFGIGAFLGLWIAIRVLRFLRSGVAEELVEGSKFRDPVPAFAALLEHLASWLPKHDAETLEGYAARLRDESLPEEAHRGAELVMSYASFRYGNIGQISEIEANIQRFLEGDAA